MASEREFRAGICRLTSVGRSAIAVLGLSGPAAVGIIERRFACRSASGSPAEWPCGRIYFGRWKFTDGLAEEVIVCRVAGLAFEVHGHGGAAVVRRLVDDCVDAGVSVRGSEDWISEPAPSRGTAGAAWKLLRDAPTERSAAILLAQVRGALDREIERCVSALRHRPQLAVNLIDDLLRRSSYGLHLVAPFEVVVAGPPNVGKSSLVNRLLGYRRSITHDRAGTTRDVLESTTILSGFPLVVTDVAGLRRSPADEVERAGVERAVARIRQADLVLWVEEAPAEEVSQRWRTLVEPDRTLFVVNKCDLGRSSAWSPQWRSVSALTGAGIEELWKGIQQSLVPHVEDERGVPFLAAHVRALRECRRWLEAGQPEEAARSLSRAACFAGAD